MMSFAANNYIAPAVGNAKDAVRQKSKYFSILSFFSRTRFELRDCDATKHTRRAEEKMSRLWKYGRLYKRLTRRNPETLGKFAIFNLISSTEFNK
jgi:hypothetical protein